MTACLKILKVKDLDNRFNQTNLLQLVPEKKKPELIQYQLNEADQSKLENKRK